MKIVGVIERKGTYEDNNYHNVNLHCTRPDENAMGVISEVVKIKFSEHENILGKKYTPEDWRNLIGKEIIPMYDKYGRTNYIKFLDGNK